MSSLKQFDSVMESLEKEADKLKRIGEIYAGVQTANKAQQSALQKLNENNVALQGALKEARAFQDEIKGVTGRLPEQAEALKAELQQLGESLKKTLAEQFEGQMGAVQAASSETIQKFQANNVALEGILKQSEVFQTATQRLLAALEEKQAQAKTDLLQAVESQLGEIRSEQSKFKQSFSENLTTLRQEYQGFHQETQDSVRAKNEEHSTQIVQLVDNQKNTFKTFVSSELADRLAEAQAKQAKQWRFLLILNGIVLLAVIVSIFMRR